MPRRHHIVSRGYQRFFADRERVLLCNTETRFAKPAGTADCFVRQGFNAYWDGKRWVEELEEEWQRREGALVPKIRGFLAGECSYDINIDTSIKILAAIHIARSYGARAVLDRLIEANRGKAVAEWPTHAELEAAFRAQYGRPSEGGEVAELVARYHDAHFGTNNFAVRQIAEIFNKSAALLRPLHVQLIRSIAPYSGFVLGETPVVHYDRDRLRVGLVVGVALFDCDHIFMPIGTRLGVCFTTRQEEPVAASPLFVKEMNSLSWRASRFVIMDPRLDSDRVLPYRVTRAE